MLVSELTGIILGAQTKSTELLLSKIASAIEYAEKYQGKQKGYYHTHHIPAKTQEAISLLVKLLVGAISDDSVWNEIHALLRFNVR